MHHEKKDLHTYISRVDLGGQAVVCQNRSIFIIIQIIFHIQLLINSAFQLRINFLLLYKCFNYERTISDTSKLFIIVLALIYDDKYYYLA